VEVVVVGTVKILGCMATDTHSVPGTAPKTSSVWLVMAERNRAEYSLAARPFTDKCLMLSTNAVTMPPWPSDTVLFEPEVSTTELLDTRHAFAICRT